MYSIIKQILNYTATGSQAINIDQYVIAASTCLIVVLTFVFIDLIYRVFKKIF